ncbi:MAG: Pentapeptide repeat (8 copies) [Firmicutes bacterium]|nr:Pentapeptide repeat (8 copies) [Bacillota bacterium]
MYKKSAKPKITEPNLPSDLPLLGVDSIQDEEVIELGLIQDSRIPFQTAENIVISQAIFRNVAFNHISLPNAKLTDIIFEKCDLSNVDFSQCFMDRVRLNNCKLIGINLTEASLRNIVFDNCNASYGVLRYFDCKKVEFKNTSFAEADMYTATLNDVSFTHCNLDKAQLSGTKLAGIDLSTCEFYQLALTPEELRGMIIAPEQAIALAGIFGVVIKE